MTYDEFIRQKSAENITTGFDPQVIKPHLFDFQRAIVEWACKRGRAAIFADTGLGKTAMQAEWAREHKETGLFHEEDLCSHQQK